ncbi:limonene-1,2-epoxide hydrolase family protein [Dermatobacter hominis]|uniref:limonene-1,2-epoxide hydrolase family protein n=1 Tax=Dermatobacter hominis TaxID=2884263 RepID=UPI001D112E11|nr:limonene-1,2-epoxide hydrolase family protein [Dermatobacter hominis]UDY34476.1 nuclear transport factor 2 family protein [Dermatobacter hominis]
MPIELLPTPATADAAPTDPQAVTEAFLAALMDSDLDAAIELLDPDVHYVNVGLPAIDGAERVRQAFKGLTRPEVSFEVYLHAISAEGPVVLTERTDVIVLGPLRLQFWVMGRFDVHDGRITLWRDGFDVGDILKSVGRGLLGIAIPGLRPAPPRSLDDAPGR